LPTGPGRGPDGGLWYWILAHAIARSCRVAEARMRAEKEAKLPGALPALEARGLAAY
jgi:hypothetical protein